MNTTSTFTSYVVAAIPPEHPLVCSRCRSSRNEGPWSLCAQCSTQEAQGATLNAVGFGCYAVSASQISRDM